MDAVERAVHRFFSEHPGEVLLEVHVGNSTRKFIYTDLSGVVEVFSKEEEGNEND